MKFKISVKNEETNKEYSFQYSALDSMNKEILKKELTKITSDFIEEIIT